MQSRAKPTIKCRQSFKFIFVSKFNTSWRVQRHQDLVCLKKRTQLKNIIYNDFLDSWRRRGNGKYPKKKVSEAIWHWHKRIHDCFTWFSVKQSHSHIQNEWKCWTLSMFSHRLSYTALKIQPMLMKNTLSHPCWRKKKPYWFPILNV